MVTGARPARFNQLAGIGQFGLASQQLDDWSDNWWGVNANSPLPSCMDPNVAANSVPQVSVSTNSSGCPSGQDQVIGYTLPVLPALSSSPQVLPEALREATAPTFGPVDTYSGALTYQVDDMSVRDAGKTITASRTYRSDRLSDGDAGTGWKTNFDDDLSASGQTSTLNLSDGSSLGFITDPATGYAPAPGVFAGFSTGSGGSTITSPNQTTYQFDSSGELTSMNWGDIGDVLSFSHIDGLLSQVTGVSDRYFSYTNSGGQLTSVTDRSGREVDFNYDGNLLSSVTGVDGKTESYSYDTAGRLTQVTAPDGLAKLAAGYDSDGRVAWIQQAGGGRTTFTYDDADGKRVITLADGTVITQLYDWAGRLVTESLGSTGTHVVYDGDGHIVASITGVPDVAMTGYSPPATVTMYNGQGDPYLTIDPMGNVTTTTFNSQHQPLVTTRPDGTTVSRAYDSNNRLTSLTDPRGKAWTYTYNSFGEMTSQTDPLGRTETMTFADNGDATAFTDETDATTHYGYDSEGLRTSVTDPLGNETDTTYTSWGAVASVTSPRGGVTTTAYDSDRRQISVTNPRGDLTGYSYDSQGRQSTTTDPLLGESMIAYDTLGRPVQLTDARGKTYQRTYTTEGWVATSTDPNGNVTHYAYDPDGRLIRVTDPIGAITQAVYDRDGNVIEVDRPDGSVQTWTYDSMDRPLQHTLPTGGVQKTSYDAAGNVLSVLGPRTNSQSALVGVTYTYDAAGRRITSTDAMGTTTTYTYDDTARSVTTTDPLGTVSVVTYNAAGKVVSRTDGAGGVTSYGYDADGSVSSVTDPAGMATTYAYNLADQLTSQTDPDLRTTQYAYDKDGRVNKITYPAGDTDTYVYDGVGNVTDHGDRNGNHWLYSYDNAGNLLTATDPLNHLTTYTYDADERQSSVTDPTGVVTNTAYDPVGRPAVTSDATGASWVTSYDGDGNVVSTTDPDGVTWNYTYDKADQLTRASWAGVFGAYTYSYDLDGRLTQKSDPYTTSYGYNVRGQATSSTDGLSHTTTYGYNGAGRLTSTTLPSGDKSTYVYDAAGRITSATDGAGDTSTYAYDFAGQLDLLTLPRGGTYAYTYDQDGRPGTQTDPLGAVTSYTFNGTGQPTSIGYPSGRVVTSQYNAAGLLTSTTSGGVTRGYGYDNAGRITGATVTGQSGNPPALSWGYNSLGLMTSSTDGLGTTTYAYDPAYRLTSRAPPAGPATTISYNSAGMPSSVGGEASFSLGYNNAGQLTNIYGRFDDPSFSYNADGQVTSVDGASASYNADGQMASLTQNEPGNPADNTTTYAYDQAGRLHTATLSRNGTTVNTTTYGWDADSDRTSVAVSGQPALTTTYNLADQPSADSTGTTYGYDADGNLTSVTPPSGPATSYSYGPFGDLTGATTPSGTMSATPDALGRVAASTDNATSQQFSYDGTSTTLAAQQSGNVTTNLIREPAGGELLGEATVGGALLEVNPTIHGDIGRLFSTSSFSNTWTAVYDPFGNPTITSTSSPPVGLAFQSMLSDPVTGLTDMGARDYSPVSGTFTSVDTLVGSPGSPVTLNRYLYGVGDPLVYFDPDGHCGWSFSWSNFVSCAEDIENFATGLYDTIAGGIGDVAGAVAGGAVSFAESAAQYAAQVKSDLAGVMHSAVAQVAQSLSPSTIKATAASLAAGGLVFLGCEAVTAGAGSLGCVTASGATSGAIYNAMTCPPGASVWRCAAAGAAAGAVSGLTFGLTMGAGPAVAGALASASGNATSQLASTGHVSADQVGYAALVGAAVGGTNDFLHTTGTTNSLTDDAADVTMTGQQPSPDTTVTPQLGVAPPATPSTGLGPLADTQSSAADTGNVVYRALNSQDVETMARGEGIVAKSPDGKWSLRDHIMRGSSRASWANDPWISTTWDRSVAEGFNESGSKLGVVAINLDQVSSVTAEGWRIFPRLPGEAGLSYYYSIWQQEVSVFQHIPQEAIMGFVR